MAEYYTDEDFSNENIDVKDDIYNYKGYFVENEEEEEKKFYEFGAHFPYKYLCHQLEIIAKEREQKQRELEDKLKEREIKEQAVNENKKDEDNLKGLLDNFKQKGKSRNRESVGIGLTYMPQMNKKDMNNLNIIDNVEINLVKSTSGQNKSKSKTNKTNVSNKSTAKSKIFNHKKNYLDINKIIDKKSAKSINKQIKIRKRNNLKNLNINSSQDNNIVYINIFKKSKLFDKSNHKNLTQDMPFISKIKDNFNHKLKS
jgi:hypothetical protein